MVWLTDTPTLAARYGEVVMEVEATIKNPVKFAFGECFLTGKIRADLLAEGHDAIQVSYPAGERAFSFGACEVFTISDLSLLRATGHVLVSRDDRAADLWHADEIAPVAATAAPTVPS